MEELGLIRDLAIVWCAAVVVGTVFLRLKLPLIAGYIVAGLITGPFGVRVISDSNQVHMLAEFGVALLLFALGVEITLKRIFSSAGKTILAGISQIILTMIVVFGCAYAANITRDLVPGLIFGLICALSSTALVTKMLVDRGETETLHGRLLVPILLIQDLSLIPIVALIPVLEHPGSDMLLTVITALVKAGLLVAIVGVGSTFIVPRILGSIARSGSRELFTLTALAICLGVAFLSKELGVSLALGAFLGGIMISERPYGHQVLADILPLRDLFGSVFFVSIGLLLNPTFIASQWIQVLLFVLLLISGKAAAGAASASLATGSLWSAGLVGIGLAQIGEFSFVLAAISYKAGLLPDSLYNLFFAGAVVTLMVSPALMAVAPRLFSRMPLLRLDRKAGHADETTPAQKMRSHLILCGYGRIGRQLGTILQQYQIPFAVVEISANIIEELHERNVPCIYGDAFSPLVLSKVNISEAACLVVTVPDAVVAVHIITSARAENSSIRIIARAHRSEDIELFRAAGANAVVQPEFEASVEITKMALIGMERSGHEVRSALKDIRRLGYMLFQPELLTDDFVEFPHEDYFGVWFIYNGSAATLQSLNARRRTGATILAIKNSACLLPHPDGSLSLNPNDQVYVAGKEQQLTAFERTFPVSRFSPSINVANDEILHPGVSD
jgi:CPA2 family monovalent cation:H+ antiporter-2